MHKDTVCSSLEFAIFSFFLLQMGLQTELV